MRSKGFELAFSIVALACLMTILQTENLFYNARSYPIFKLFLFISIPLMLLWVIFSITRYNSHGGIIYYCVQKFKSLQIPKTAKYFIGFVVVANFISISFGEAWYPFHDVGMFRWSTSSRVYDKEMTQHKYFYWKDGQYKILDLRREGTFFMAEHFGWSYTEEFMFAARFRNRGEKKNFEFLAALLKEQGVDTLWVGVHTVNFKTQEVNFDPDICSAVAFNQESDLYYGPIYIPDYQLNRCHED